MWTLRSISHILSARSAYLWLSSLKSYFSQALQTLLFPLLKPWCPAGVCPWEREGQGLILHTSLLSSIVGMSGNTFRRSPGSAHAVSWPIAPKGGRSLFCLASSRSCAAEILPPCELCGRSRSFLLKSNSLAFTVRTGFKIVLRPKNEHERALVAVVHSSIHRLVPTNFNFPRPSQAPSFSFIMPMALFLGMKCACRIRMYSTLFWIWTSITLKELWPRARCRMLQRARILRDNSLKLSRSHRERKLRTWHCSYRKKSPLPRCSVNLALFILSFTRHTGQVKESTCCQKAWQCRICALISQGNVLKVLMWTSKILCDSIIIFFITAFRTLDLHSRKLS